MDYTFLLASLENILGKGQKRARENYAFHCPFCNHRKPKLEILGSVGFVKQEAGLSVHYLDS